jgi:hypothetical protein
MLVFVRDHAAHSPAAIEQYPHVAFPRPFELGAGSKLSLSVGGPPLRTNLIGLVSEPIQLGAQCRLFSHGVAEEPRKETTFTNLGAPGSSENQTAASP